jgi:hypothetical protein
MVEGTFLDPLNASEDLMRAVGRNLEELAFALQSIGLAQLASQMREMAEDLSSAREELRKGRDMALRTYVSGAEAATSNMINAALTSAEGNKA